MYLMQNPLIHIYQNIILPIKQYISIHNVSHIIHEMSNAITTIPQYTINPCQAIMVDLNENQNEIIYYDQNKKYYTDGSNTKNPGKVTHGWMETTTKFWNGAVPYITQ